MPKKSKKKKKRSSIVKYCDSCSGEFRGAGKIRRLPIGGNAGIFLCRKCWAKEMKWRKERNKNLAPSNRFSIRKFPT